MTTTLRPGLIPERTMSGVTIRPTLPVGVVKDGGVTMLLPALSSLRPAPRGTPSARTRSIRMLPARSASRNT